MSVDHEPTYPDDWDDYGDECGNCGGEGFVYHCIDGFCVDAEEGCDLCAMRCDWCNPPKRKVMPPNEVEALRKVLADALSPHTEGEEGK